MVSAKYGADSAEVRALELKNELSLNQLMTPARAVQAVRAEEAIRRGVGPKLEAIYGRLTTAISDRLSQRPELLKPFTEEKPASDELKQSRARVKAVLDDARKKAGR